MRWFVYSLLGFIYIYILSYFGTGWEEQGSASFFFFGKGGLMLTLSLCGAVGESGWGYD